MHLILGVNDGMHQHAWEPVHVQPMAQPELFRVEYSPGLIQGIAAGDIIRVADGSREFTVIERGGNVAVQMFRLVPITPHLQAIDQCMKAIHGQRDGQIEKGCVFTVPLAMSGFAAIEAVMSHLMDERLIDEWLYGNVYDQQGRPLMWWP